MFFMFAYNHVTFVVCLLSCAYIFIVITTSTSIIFIWVVAAAAVAAAVAAAAAAAAAATAAAAASVVVVVVVQYVSDNKNARGPPFLIRYNQQLVIIEFLEVDSL